MKPELLAPVADWVMLKAAIAGKADAVYFGVKQLNMRINAKNFELSELNKIVQECHSNKVKAYLTLNTIVYENELDKIKLILRVAKKAKIDGIICWDFSVINECSRLRLPLHISTQAGVSNFEAVKSYSKLGVKRIVLARECSLDQIKDIIEKIKKNKLKVEIEAFIHGAMCISVSGRCFISQFLFNKSANRGDCLQPCRRSYIVKDLEEGHELELDNSYVMSPKDLCTIEFIDKLIDAGIRAFKIEGRNRSPEYVKTVVECYRQAVDGYLNNKKINIKKLKNKLKTVYNREFSSGFYLGKPTDKDFTNYYGSAATQKKVYLGYVRNYYAKIKVAELKLETGSIKLNDTLMVQGNKTGVFEQKITSMQFLHKNIKTGKKGQRIAVKVNKQVRLNDKVFVIR